MRCHLISASTETAVLRLSGNQSRDLFKPLTKRKKHLRWEGSVAFDSFEDLPPTRGQLYTQPEDITSAKEYDLCTPQSSKSHRPSFLPWKTSPLLGLHSCRATPLEYIGLLGEPSALRSLPSLGLILMLIYHCRVSSAIQWPERARDIPVNKIPNSVVRWPTPFRHRNNPPITSEAESQSNFVSPLHGTKNSTRSLLIQRDFWTYENPAPTATNCILFYSEMCLM